MQKTLGGDRLGAGKQNTVNLHGFGRSNQDLGFILRTTMSSGTLVPFLNIVALPGDTLDINMDAIVNTHPTIGPLFASFKLQLDLFKTPLRLYNARTHNNEINIGRDMSQIKFPQIVLTAEEPVDPDGDPDNCQINPSCILAYLGIRGIGALTATGSVERQFNGIPILNYWEIYKNYYSNKQEEIGAVIHVNTVGLVNTVDNPILIDGFNVDNVTNGSTPMGLGTTLALSYTGASPIMSQVKIFITPGGSATIDQLFINIVDDGISLVTGEFDYTQWGDITAVRWGYVTNTVPIQGQPQVATFPLGNIDTMRRKILQQDNTVFLTNDYNEPPYKWLPEIVDTIPNILSSQEGLGIKTYQSDLFNNWIKTDWIDGPGGINTLTAVDVSSGSLQLDQLVLANKVYNLLNRIAVAGGTFSDWQDAQWAHNRMRLPESPIYCGGLSKEVIFQEVVSNSEASGQPLGTLAGKGTLAKKHKGGRATIKVDEPSIIMGIMSLTPRIDYSQGNDWTTGLTDFGQLFTPALDQIGFQDLPCEQMAWWSTEWSGTEWVQKSAGKQPAWQNYRTAVNKCLGNFAIRDNEMFMTNNRQYEFDNNAIGDLTTYIDPVKFNQIFAQTALDAQNFWVQIAVDIHARRKMSNKVMPNL